MQPFLRSPDMNRAARELGMSARSLRRRLGEEGSSFRTVTQAALHDAACSMVRNPTMTFKAISHTLGFAEVSSFNRAFKRWTGATPAQFREASLGPKPS
jgi:AraC-like DNA-binding protein